MWAYAAPSLYIDQHIHLWKYTYNLLIYIHIYRERERGRGRHILVCVRVYIYKYLTECLLQAVHNSTRPVTITLLHCRTNPDGPILTT